MTLYSIDFYDRKLNYVNSAEIIDCPSNFIIDYVTLEKVNCQLKGEHEIVKGYFATIYESDTIVYQGIVEEYEADKYYTNVSILPLYSLLDFNVFETAANIAKINKGTTFIENWISDRLLEAYVNTTDEKQKLGSADNFVIDILSSTKVTVTKNNANVYNVYDIVVAIFNLYGVVINIKFSATTKKFNVVIRSIDSENIKVVDSNETDVISFDMNTSSSDKPNKLTYFNTAATGTRATFYWHPDGFSGYIDEKPDEPRDEYVKFDIRGIAKNSDDSSWKVTATNAAYDAMYHNSYGDEIRIQALRDSKTIILGDIGDKYIVIDRKDKRFYSVLTAVEYLSDKEMVMTFGMARTKLTQEVRKQWRILNNETNQS